MEFNNKSLLITSMAIVLTVVSFSTCTINCQNTKKEGFTQCVEQTGKVIECNQFHLN